MVTKNLKYFLKNYNIWHDFCLFDNIEMAKRLGVYDFLEKPFYIEKLVKVVNKAIEKGGENV